MEALSRLGIDLWSILLYVVNMGVLVWLLAKYLFPKILHFLDERRNQIRQNLEEAEKLKDELSKQNKSMEDEKKLLQSTLQQELTDSRRAMEKKKKEAESEIDDKRSKMMEEIQSAIRDEKNNLIGNTQKDILSMVEKMVNYIVSNQIPVEVVKKSVNEAWGKYSGK